MIRALTVCLTLLAANADAKEFYFCWKGSNEYTMTGRMTIPDAALSQPLVTEQQVTRFKIAGYHQGRLLGTWNAQQREPDDTWVLNFDPTTNSFLPGDALPTGYSQGWNADGTAEDCGPGGFGFNSGNYAQDFCLNGVWIEESGLAPPTPFLVSERAMDAMCRLNAPMS